MMLRRNILWRFFDKGGHCNTNFISTFVAVIIFSWSLLLQIVTDNICKDRITHVVVLIKVYKGKWLPLFETYFVFLLIHHFIDLLVSRLVQGA